jgi:hypothetical protein
MMLSKKAIGKRFGILAALVAALVIACTGVVLAQSSTANAGYENTNPVSTPSDAIQAGVGPVTNGSAAASDVSALARVPNGGFENGTFRGWMRVNQSGGSGNWFVYSGTSSPRSGHTIAAPPNGSFAATTDQIGPGSHVLYRDIRLKPGMTHKLSFYLYYRNFADGFFTPKTLDYTEFPNQQYRVDVLKPTANPFTVKRSAILATIFRTKVGDPNRLAPKLRTFNLTPFVGKTVRLRFAEVDNQFNFLASVDKVKVTSTSAF